MLIIVIVLSIFKLSKTCQGLEDSNAEMHIFDIFISEINLFLHLGHCGAEFSDFDWSVIGNPRVIYEDYL